MQFFGFNFDIKKYSLEIFQENYFQLPSIIQIPRYKPPTEYNHVHPHTPKYTPVKKKNHIASHKRNTYHGKVRRTKREGIIFSNVCPSVRLSVTMHKAHSFNDQFPGRGEDTGYIREDSQTWHYANCRWCTSRSMCCPSRLSLAILGTRTNRASRSDLYASLIFIRRSGTR